MSTKNFAIIAQNLRLVYFAIYMKKGKKGKKSFLK